MKKLSDGIEKNVFCSQTFDGYFIKMDKQIGSCCFCAMGVAVLSTEKMTLTDMINDSGFGIKKILDDTYFDFALSIEQLDHIEAKFDLARFSHDDSVPRVRKPLSVNLQNYDIPSLFNLTANLNDRYRLSFPEIVEIVRYAENEFGVNAVPLGQTNL